MSHLSSAPAFCADAKPIGSFITGSGVQGLAQSLLLVRGQAGVQTSGSIGTQSLALLSSVTHHLASGFLSKAKLPKPFNR